MSLRKAESAITTTALRAALGASLATLAALVVSCAANPESTGSASNSSTGTVNDMNSSLMSARVQFDFQDFYSLSFPNQSGCAGDVMNLYDPLANRNPASVGQAPEPVPLTSAGGEYGGTYRPSFIKNVSVDITDANSTAPTNLASGCAMGVAGASACATFDYGANGGVSSTLAGSMLLLGGIQNSNYSGINGSIQTYGLSVGCGPASSSGLTTSCGTSLYAMGVNGLPASAATDPPSDLAPGLDTASTAITGFVNLAASSEYGSTTDPGPQDFIAGAGAYDPGVGEVALFGGTSVVATGGVVGSLSATGESATNDTTWLYNLSTQAWTQISPAPNVATDLEETFEEYQNGSSETVNELSNLTSPRANFGYAPTQGMALDAMSTGSALSAYSYTGSVDTTDRIIIAGGQDSAGFLSDSYKFNPTYGPEWVDTMTRSVDSPQTGEATQWLVSYETVPLFNTTTAAEMEPSYNGSSAVLSTNFGLAPIRNNDAGSFGAGYPLFVGGFDTTQATGVNPYLDSCPTSASGTCGMMIGARTGSPLPTSLGSSTEDDTSNFSFVGNLLESAISISPYNTSPTGTQITPVNWGSNSYKALGSSSLASAVVPWFGGATALPGFNLDYNDVVFFGGSTCETYLTSCSTTGGTVSFANPGEYYRFGADPIANGSSVPQGTPAITGNPGTFTMASSASCSGTCPPARAGMAVARGTDPSGNDVMIVAFGGMSAPDVGTDQSIYYLYNAGSQDVPQPTWVKTTASGTAPNVPTNGALVFSHVTKNFYLFGGYSSATGTVQGDTWELSVGGGSTCAANGSCTFSWTQLDITGGTTCSPNCPPARRSHKMVEVNYSNRNPGGTISTALIGDGSDGESACSSTYPCSYGIFMEGGTSDGVALLGDRWMFDPTANGGYGSWQQIHEMPARNLAAMATTDFSVASSVDTVHRAVLFGGEMGMSDPAQALATANQYYVPPTLGDTWMYDFDNNTWNRVQLLGAGYNGLPSSVSGATELSNRQSYDATDGTGATIATTDQREVSGGVNHANVLSPPPTSGAIMITRNLSSLAIPEVYMVGGRLKDGTFASMEDVYKFCAGSTGESYYSGLPGFYALGVPNDGSGSGPRLGPDYTCDAYNASATNTSTTISNSYSLSPSSSYVGRWLLKVPTSGSGLTSFMGAGAYDSADDLLAVYGGLQDSSSGHAVTDSLNRTISPNVYEYTFPAGAVTAPAAQGVWTTMGVCAGSATPTPRYGHSMVYNSQLGALVVVGGYDINGNPLQQIVSGASGSYETPEIWEGQRNSADSCYTWTEITTIGNSIAGTQAPPMTGLSQMIGVYVPPTGYNTGYYSTYDASCAGVGPISSDDPSQSKLLAGGAYFDIDRTQLGPNENLLLNLTFMPLNEGNTGPTGTSLPSTSDAYFRIHLVKTGETQAELEETFQPRYLTYTTNLTTYPETVQTLSVLAPPNGQVQQQQILIPLTDDPGIDRIRIERYQGNAILIDAALYRMGYR